MASFPAGGTTRVAAAHMALLEIQNKSATRENALAVLYEVKHPLPYKSPILLQEK